MSVYGPVDYGRLKYHVENAVRSWWELDIENKEEVRKLMERTGLVEGRDWWIVDWTDEGLPDPGTGQRKVLKLRIPAQGKAKIAIPIPRGNYGRHFFMRVYLPSNVNVKIQRRWNIGDVQYPWSGEGYSINIIGNDAWRNIGYYTAALHDVKWFIVVMFENSGDSDAYVYISYIIIEEIWSIYFWKHGLMDNERNDIAGATWDQNYIFFLPAKTKIWFHVRIASDGINPVTVAVYVRDARYGWKKVYEISRTSSTIGGYKLRFNVKYVYSSHNSWYAHFFRVVVDASASSNAYVSYSFSTTPTPDGGDFDRVVKRVEGSYTSDGDGSTDTVTLLDYTSSTKHVGRLLRVKATGDANTTQLQLRVDGEIVWDFLKDGDTCTLDIRDATKVELLVNDPGGGTSTTVSYVVQYEEEDSVIVR